MWMICLIVSQWLNSWVKRFYIIMIVLCSTSLWLIKLNSYITYYYLLLWVKGDDSKESFNTLFEKYYHFIFCLATSMFASIFIFNGRKKTLHICLYDEASKNKGNLHVYTSILGSHYYLNDNLRDTLLKVK